LADIGLLFNGYLASVGTIFSPWVTRVDKDSLVLVGNSATGKLEGTAGSKAVGARSNGSTCSPGTLGVSEAGTRVSIVSVTGGVLKTDDG